MAKDKIFPYSQMGKEVSRTIGAALVSTPPDQLTATILSTFHTPDQRILHDQVSKMRTHMNVEKADHFVPSWLNVESFNTEMAKFNNPAFLQVLLHSSSRYHLGLQHKLPPPKDFKESVEGHPWKEVVHAAHSAVGMSAANTSLYGWSVISLGLGALYGDKFYQIVKPRYRDDPFMLAAQEVASAHPQQPKDAEEAVQVLYEVFSGEGMDALIKHGVFEHSVQGGIRRCPMKGDPSQHIFTAIAEVLTTPSFTEEFKKSITK